MADTIFMIHGMWGGPWYWENFRRVFEAQGYRCVAATLPEAHQRSMTPRWPEDHITPASVVRKVARKYKAVSTYKEFENHAHWVIV